MEKKDKLKFISYGAFTVSLIFTVRLMLSNCSSIIDYILIPAMAIIFELSKILMLHTAIKRKNIVYGGLFIILFLCSVVASQSFLINQNNSNIQAEIKHSSEYRAIKEEIKELKKIRASYSDKYITKKKNLGKEILELEGSLQDIKIISTNGNNEFFKLIAENINKNKIENKVTTNQINIYFSMILAITFELLAIALFYLHLEENTDKNATAQTTEKPVAYSSVESLQPINRVDCANGLEEVKKEYLQEEKREIVPLVAQKNVIGFKPEYATAQKEQNFTTEQFEKYKKFMIEDAKNKETNVSLGYKKIADSIGISYNKALSIKNKLKEDNIVRSEGNRTYILEGVN